MALVKSFPDAVTGEPLLIQAAGTVYNEELNSLALGKDTVADGEDQLVFGRYNKTGEASNESKIANSLVWGDSTYEIVYLGVNPNLSEAGVYASYLSSPGMTQYWPHIWKVTKRTTSQPNGTTNDVKYFMSANSYIPNGERIRGVFIGQAPSESEPTVHGSNAPASSVTYNVAESNLVEIVGGGEYANSYSFPEIGTSVQQGNYVYFRNVWYAGCTYEDLKLCISSVFGIQSDNIEIVTNQAFAALENIVFDCIFLVVPSIDRLLYYAHGVDGKWYSTLGYISYNNSVNFPLAASQDASVKIVRVTYDNAGNFDPGKASERLRESFNTKILERKNIRTLDWDGNQWNKGDVTCDDGSGNTISMRGLAAYKANVYETENIEALDGMVIEKLKAGDIIIKKGENSNHAYRVSFKNATGMCLTYADAENVETIAYDKTGDTWAKTDKTVTGITGKAAADHNHDVVYAAKTHTHNIADVTGLQLALNGKMGNLLSLNMSADTGNSTFPIDSTESGVLDRYAHGINADEWHPVCVNLFEDEVAVGQVFGFAKVTFGTNSATIVVVIGNKKFSTASTSFSNDTYAFEAWTKASVGQSFFS